MGLNDMDITTIDDTVNDISLMISEGRTEEAQIEIDRAISSGFNSHELIKAVSNRSIEMIEDGFNNNRIYLPTMVKSSEFISKIVDEEYGQSGNDKRKTVVIGTVLGDIHEIGKNLCAAALKCKGYKIHDLGCDVPPDRFIKTAMDEKAQLIAVSAPMSTTKAVQKIVVENAKSNIDDIYILIGGATCSQKWCNEIKADGYSRDWKDFIKLVNEKIGD